jgi:Ca2+ transporting ATPase
MMRTLRITIIALCILIVAIPEGLPLAVSVAMALSISKMKKDKILIKNVESVQKCAILHDICVSKTGTLTEGEMHVGSYHVVGEDQVHPNDPHKNPTNFNEEVDINVELKDLIKEAITMNTDARIEIGEDEDAEYKYLAKGQALEVGMIDFLLENGEDVHSLFVKRNVNCVTLIQFPFDPVLKRKTVVRNNATNSESVRIYVKGAPEEVIPLCNATVDNEILSVEFGREDQERVLEHINNEICGYGHKPITYAFKEIPKSQLHQLMNFQQKNAGRASVHENIDDKDEDDAYRREFESDLFYLATFGLDDPLRAEINTPINLIKYGHTDAAADTATQANVRMISGDHLETCKVIAARAGIVKPTELNLENTALTGEEFRQAIGPYQKYWDKDNHCWSISFDKPDLFKTVKKKVKIIARATPADKFVLIRGIQQQGGLIGMAGDGIADSEVLKQADVGLCMGTGCDVAKDNSDLVITDNDFQSIRRAILWGRAMFDNVRKFLQFQLTINLSVVSIVFISGLTLGDVPFNVIQLLWINLIMDILAAISLGTEPITERN